MATATFQATKDAGLEPTRPGTAVVDLDGSPVQIPYWPSLISQWGAAGVKAYVCAEALWNTGNYADAHTAAGTIPDGGRWIAEHPLPAGPLI